MATVYVPENYVDPEPTPVLRCWECDEYVQAAQRLRSVALYRAIICSDCEPWIRTLLHGPGACLEPGGEDRIR